MGISNWCGENFIGWWAADFQIYILRFPSAKHSEESMEAQIILNRDVPLTLYGEAVKPVKFLLVYTYNFECNLISNAKIPPHQISFPMRRYFLFTY